MSKWSSHKLRQVFHPLLNPASNSIFRVKLHKLQHNYRFRAFMRKAYLEGEFKSFLPPDFGLKAKNLKSIESSFDLLLLFRARQNIPKPKPFAAQAEVIEKYNENDKVNLTLEECLESIGCCVKGLSAFNYYCELNGIYDYFTQDYVDKLSKYITSVSETISADLNVKEITILEVGAGPGILADMISSTLDKENTSLKIRYIATDRKVPRTRYPKEFEVEELDYRESILKYDPHIVICSWLPNSVDWTEDFLKLGRSMQQYILIGEAEDGCCGHQQLTWGNFNEAKFPEFNLGKPAPSGYTDIFYGLSELVLRRANKSAEIVAAAQDTPVGNSEINDDQLSPAFIRYGWTKREIQPLSLLQISRYDSLDSPRNSSTVVFTKPELSEKLKTMELYR